MTFRILFGINALAAAVMLFFFLTGLSDGSVSSFNLGLWLSTLAAIAAILGGGYALHAANKPVLAILVLLILALPAVAYVSFFLILFLTVDRWN